MDLYEKKYKEALEKAKEFYALCEKCGAKDTVDFLEDSFPELKESEDEKIRKAMIKGLSSCASKYWGGFEIKAAIAWLEKQGEQEQLYIRFGEIPTDEKSKIFQGEIEVGTENGVSAYPAFKTSEGDIVLGLSLPITKTTLYTQQHLIEYDDRPCYLVKGDYVGKDTDGQPLINNVSIIEKIDTYRVKEEKQDEQKPTDKIEPKFHEGEWVVISTSGGEKVVQIDSIEHFKSGEPMYITSEGRWFGNGTKAHLWTIQDAKDGDVLAEDTCTFIIKKLNHDLTAEIYCCLYDDGDFELNSNLGFDDTCTYPATKEQRDLLFQKMTEAGYEWDAEKKELRLLITNGGDFFESENCEQKPAEWKQENREELTEFENAMMHIGGSFFGENAGLDPNDTDTIKEQAELLLGLAPKTEWSGEDAYNSKLILSTISQDQDLSLETKDKLTSWLKSLKDRVHPKQEWNKGDMEMLNAAISFVELSSFSTIGKGKNNTVAWLKSLKSRVLPQLKHEWSKEDEKMISRIRSIIEKYAFSQSAVDVNGDLCEKIYIDMDNWLKSLKQEIGWKPSDEQMKALHDLNLTGNISYAGQGQVLIELYNDLKKLTE